MIQSRASGTYYCSICGAAYVSADVARHCELRGKPPLYPLGLIVRHLDGVGIIDGAHAAGHVAFIHLSVAPHDGPPSGDDAAFVLSSGNSLLHLLRNQPVTPGMCALVRYAEGLGIADVRVAADLNTPTICDCGEMSFASYCAHVATAKEAAHV